MSGLVQRLHSHQRYTQALHTQTLTQQSLTHVRAELTALRSRSQRQTADKLSVGEAADKIAEAERRYEEMRDQCEVEARAAKEESRKRKRADARVEELEAQLRARRTELEEVKEARTRDAQELLANAKERLSILHTEVNSSHSTPLIAAVRHIPHRIAGGGARIPKDARRPGREQRAAQARRVRALTSAQ